MRSQWHLGGVAAFLLILAAGPAQAQFYGGGYWGRGYGGYGGVSTAQGSELQGAGMYAMGMGRYNVESSQARSINADTAMRWNQYMYQSRIEGERIYNKQHAAEEAKQKGNYDAIQSRVRNNPNEFDIAEGSALNSAFTELSNPMIFKKVVDYGGKMKLGGEAIRDIPFQYASAGISTSVHQLTQNPAPAPFQREEFAQDRAKLKALAAEIRKESEETGTPKPETIEKAKAQLMAIKAKVESIYPQASQQRRDAEKYIKSLYGLASMLETPAMNVLLSGADKRPDASVGDLLGFMAAYNLRFGASKTPRQREIYRTLYPMLAKLRGEITAPQDSNPAMAADAPGAVFEGLGYNHTETPSSPAPAPAPR